MIQTCNNELALYFIHRVLIEARLMAYENVDQSKIASFLDIAELLPKDLAGPEDETADFRRLLVALADERPHILHLLRRFDEGNVPRW